MTTIDDDARIIIKEGDSYGGNMIPHKTTVILARDQTCTDITWQNMEVCPESCYTGYRYGAMEQYLKFSMGKLRNPVLDKDI